MPTEPWVYALDICPWCQGVNAIPFSLKPHTAGTRGLSISGTCKEDFEHAACFLRELQTALGLNYASLREHFDFVVASGIGALFAFGIFGKDWTIDDCLKHFNKADKNNKHWKKNVLRSFAWPMSQGRDPLLSDASSSRGRKLARLGLGVKTPPSPGLLEGGVGTKIAITDMKQASLANIISTNYRESILTVEDEKKISQPCSDQPDSSPTSSLDLILKEQQCIWPHGVGKADVLISCEPNTTAQHTTSSSQGLLWQDRSLLSWAAEKLIASLFYVEFRCQPSFYRSPISCQLSISCRLAAGPALADLVMQLRQKHAHFHYGTSLAERRALPVCDDIVWTQVKHGQPFLRFLEMEIVSINSLICIQVQTTGIVNEDDVVSKGRHWISNCPYDVKFLIRDQGLDCVFGHIDHQSRKLKSA
ncbi:hypothetical protein EG329_003764 [Mollisiaceae sp. DMI_Dod_QoI]|nr:hypothetical protein EG329_003764 [Helotiales sp. DMI_Dod_QoI]